MQIILAVLVGCHISLTGPTNDPLQVWSATRRVGDIHVEPYALACDRLPLLAGEPRDCGIRWLLIAFECGLRRNVFIDTRGEGGQVEISMRPRIGVGHAHGNIPSNECDPGDRLAILAGKPDVRDVANLQLAITSAWSGIRRLSPGEPIQKFVVAVLNRGTDERLHDNRWATIVLFRGRKLASQVAGVRT
jgi:hypothetical protein